MFGRRRRDYRGADFSVRIVYGFRELLTIVLTRPEKTWSFDAESIGKGWRGIGLNLPKDLAPTEVPQVVHDLETSFAAMGWGFVITRTVAVDAVSDAEQNAALAELNAMGFEVERSADLRQVTLKPIPGVRRDAKSAAVRMPTLIRALSGRRPRSEVLAVSKDFAADLERYIPR